MALTLTEAWAFAQEFFKHPNNQKLSRSNSKRGKQQKIIEGLDSSFIRINSCLNASPSSSSAQPYTVYRIIEGQRVVDRAMRGTYGRLKKVEDSSGQSSYVKIQTARFKSLETKVLEMLGYSTGDLITDDRKQYIQMTNLGTPFINYILNNASLSHSNNLQLLIQLCQQTYQLHCRGFAHLDIKSQNITINDDQQLKLIDYGTVKENPDALFYNSVGTYWYRPRENHQLTGRELDTIAVLRTAYLGRAFQGADQSYSITRRPASIFNKTEIEAMGLASILNTDLDKRPTLKSFIDNKIDLLALQAMLIKRFYQLTLDDELLINNPRLAYLLASLWSAQVSKQDVDSLLINPVPFMNTTLKNEFIHYAPYVLEQLFFASHLHPRIDLHQLAQSKKQQFVFKRLEQLRQLRHLPSVLRSPTLLKIYSHIDTPEELLKAIEIILNEVPGDADHYRESRIQCLLADPTQALSSHPAIEQALWLNNEHQLNYPPEQIRADRKLALFINCINPYTLLRVNRAELQENPALVEKIITDGMPGRFIPDLVAIYRENSVDENTRNRFLLTRLDLFVAYIAGMLPQQFDLSFLLYCNEDTCIALRAIFSCHFDSTSEYIILINKIYQRTVFHSQCPVDNKIATLVHSKAKKVEPWLHAIAERQQENIGFFLPAFNLLTEQNASGPVFDKTMHLFTKYSKAINHDILLTLLKHNQLNEGNIKRLRASDGLIWLIMRFPGMTSFFVNAPGFEDYFARLSAHLYISPECMCIFLDTIKSYDHTSPVWTQSVINGPGIHAIARCIQLNITNPLLYTRGLQDPLYSRLLRTANDSAQFKNAETLAANLTHLLALCRNKGIDNQSINKIMTVLEEDDCNYDKNDPARAPCSSTPLFNKLFNLMIQAQKEIAHSVLNQKLDHILNLLNKMLPDSALFFSSSLETRSTIAESSQERVSFR